MKVEKKVIALSIAFGLFVCVVDAVLDFYFFYEGTFWDLLIYNVPKHEVYIRSVILASFTIFGIIIASIMAKRKPAEEAPRESEKRARQYLDIAGVVFVALDTKGNITLINKRGLELLGYRGEELLGKNWFKTCLPERMTDEVLDVYHKLIRGEVEPVEYYENPVLTKDGKERIIAWHNSVLRNPVGEIVGTLGSS